MRKKSHPKRPAKAPGHLHSMFLPSTWFDAALGNGRKKKSKSPRPRRGKSGWL